MIVCLAGAIYSGKDGMIVADGALPPVLVVPFPDEDGHSHPHSRILGHNPHEQVPVRVQKVPRRVFGMPQKFHYPNPDELHHLQEVQELNKMFHHVEDEHRHAQQEHHRDPIKTHYSIDSAGRINHVTVEEVLAHNKAAHNMHPNGGKMARERPTAAELEREERNHARLHNASEKLVSELLHEDRMPEGEPEDIASFANEPDLEKDDWLYDQQEKQGHKWPILLVLVVIAIVAAVSHLEYLPTMIQLLLLFTC